MSQGLEYRIDKASTGRRHVVALSVATEPLHGARDSSLGDVALVSPS